MTRTVRRAAESRWVPGVLHAGADLQPAGITTTIGAQQVQSLIPSRRWV